MEYINISFINLFKEILKIIIFIYLFFLIIGLFVIILGIIIFFFSNCVLEDFILIDL